MSKYSRNIPHDQRLLHDHFGKTYEAIQEGATVLDFGCSTGYYGELLMKEKGCTVDGVELSEADAKIAAKKLRNVYMTNVEHNGWPADLVANRYDVVFFGDVIEHLLDPRAVLKKVASLLKKYGVIIISTPNVAHLSVRLELLGGNFDYEPLGILDETHTKYFTSTSLQRLVNEAGLETTIVDYSLNPMPPDAVKDWLEKLGLTPSEKFLDQMETPEAQAYQFKIVTRRATTTKKPKRLDLAQKPLAARDRYVGELNKAWTDVELVTKQFRELETRHRSALLQLEKLRHKKESKLDKVQRKVRGRLKRLKQK